MQKSRIQRVFYAQDAGFLHCSGRRVPFDQTGEQAGCA